MIHSAIYLPNICLLFEDFHEFAKQIFEDYFLYIPVYVEQHPVLLLLVSNHQLNLDVLSQIDGTYLNKVIILLRKNQMVFKVVCYN
jgi:hypothetical protein